jgi:hypothetical protein
MGASYQEKHRSTSPITEVYSSQQKQFITISNDIEDAVLKNEDLGCIIQVKGDNGYLLG